MRRYWVPVTLLTAISIACAVIWVAESHRPPHSSSKPTPGLEALKVAAESGTPEAQLGYGKAILQQALAVYDKAVEEHSNVEAAKDVYFGARAEAGIWIKKAADQDSGEAWFWLGYAGLRMGHSDLYNFEQAADKGYPRAFRYLLDGLLFRAERSADIVTAKKYSDLARKLHIKIYDTLDAPDIIDQCYEAGSPDIPPSDRPSPEEQKAFKQNGGSCIGFQYGLDTAQDWVKYRKCVLSQDYVNNNDVAEIYANGWGVKRNPQLAVALVCHGSLVPTELAGMVNTLHSTRKQRRLQKAFTFCDYVTSAMNGGYCAAQAEILKDAKREREFANLMQDWTDTQKQDFGVLQKAAEDFASEHARSEQDLSGASRAEIAIKAEATLRDQFLSEIKTNESNHFPSDPDFDTAAKELNRLYAGILRKDKVDELGTITKEGVQATQRKWLLYRDAWTRFAASRYPGTSPTLWQAWLTKERIAQLKEVVGQDE